MVRRWVLAISVLSMTLLFGCAARTAVVTDQNETNTNLRDLKLEESPYLKIVMGGAIREIPLNDVLVLEIDPATSTVFERELYFSARLRLRESSTYLKLLQVYREQTSSTPIPCFISIRNTLQGKHSSETYRIPLDKLVEIKYNQ